MGMGIKKMKYKITYFILLSFIISSLISCSQPSIINDKIAHLNFENASLCPMPIDVLQAKSNEVYRYVCKRMNTSLNTTIHVTFKPQLEGKTIRGTTSATEITIFIKENVTQDYILGVLAHETGHVAINDSGIGSSIYPQLNEGFATWLAGDYWLNWHKISSFSKGINPNIDKEQCLSLEDNNRVIQDITSRDEVYNAWASFIDFLIKTYGLDRFKKFLSGTCEEEFIKNILKEYFNENPESQEFQIHLLEVKYNSITNLCKSIYGKSFEDLRKEWILYILNG